MLQAQYLPGGQMGGDRIQGTSGFKERSLVILANRGFTG